MPRFPSSSLLDIHPGVSQPWSEGRASNSVRNSVSYFGYRLGKSGFELSQKWEPTKIKNRMNWNNLDKREPTID